MNASTPDIPPCRPEDFGRPIVNCEHAVSVALPTWQNVIDYEEQVPETLRSMRCGYPRFFLHPQVQEATDLLAKWHCARPREVPLVMVSRQAAQGLVDFLQSRNRSGAHVELLGPGEPALAIVPEEDLNHAREYWRYSGEGISSRRAQAIVEGRADHNPTDLLASTIRERLAESYGVEPKYVFLSPSGMAAILEVYRALAQSSKPKQTFYQLGFPYVDGWRVLKEFGPDATLLPELSAGAYETLLTALREDKIAALFLEFPNNPLMGCVDLDRISGRFSLCRTPIVIDDTLSGPANTDTLSQCDLVTNSLTKLFTGNASVMGGAIIINPQGPRALEFVARFNRPERDEALWWEDLVELEKASADYIERATRTSRNTEKVYAELQADPRIDHIYFSGAPENRELYDAVKKPAGGYPSLLAFTLKDAATRTPPFYDALALAKGPSLGTNFTLVCPYTQLAHYQELDWAESVGVSRYLIRAAIGLEEPGTIIQAFQSALDVAFG